MRFETISHIDKNIVSVYVKEAIENQKLGKEIKPQRTKKEFTIPTELKHLITVNPFFKKSFNSLSPYNQKRILRIHKFGKTRS